MGLAIRMRNKRTGTTGTFAKASVLGSDWEPIDKDAGLPDDGLPDEGKEPVDKDAGLPKSDSATDEGEEPKVVAEKSPRKTASKSTAEK